MSIPKQLRQAVPVDGHGYTATVAEFGDNPTRRERRQARQMAMHMQKWCGDCRAHNRHRARLSRMRAAYARRR